jgi:hypothetical protein
MRSFEKQLRSVRAEVDRFFKENEFQTNASEKIGDKDANKEKKENAGGVKRRNV